MIYLFASLKFSPTSIIISNYLSVKLNIKNKIITDFEFVDKKTSIVLPIGINACKTCYNANIKHCLVSSPETYDLLNNKDMCAKFVKNINIPLIDTFIFERQMLDHHLINFLNKFDDNQVFILKEHDTAGTRGMIIADKNRILNENIDKNNGIDLSNYILQPYLDNNILYSYNIMCKDGVIITSLLVKQDTLYNRERIIKKNYISSERIIVDDNDKNYERILFYSSQILKKAKYNGICEIEYLYDKMTDSILFLEVNPRISGHFMLLYENKLLYIEKLVYSYINFLQNSHNNFNYLIKNDNFNKKTFYSKPYKSYIGNNHIKRGRNIRVIFIIVAVTILITMFLVKIYMIV